LLAFGQVLARTQSAERQAVRRALELFDGSPPAAAAFPFLYDLGQTRLIEPRNGVAALGEVVLRPYLFVSRCHIEPRSAGCPHIAVTASVVSSRTYLSRGDGMRYRLDVVPLTEMKWVFRRDPPETALKAGHSC
jgi:hypothetical protein